MISEKSLELNVSENIINRIRNLKGIYSRAFLYGFTSKQESVHGPDLSIKIPLPLKSKFLFALQYKAPRKKLNNKYIFKINNNRKYNQHIRLLITSLFFNDNSVYYAFPLFINTDELSQHSPNFLSRTYFVKIIDFPPCTFDRRKHTVEIDLQSGKAYVSSPVRHEIKIYDANEFFKELENRWNKLEDASKIMEKKLTEENIIDKLKEKGFQQEDIKRILEVVDEMKIHHVRYSFWLTNIEDLILSEIKARQLSNPRHIVNLIQQYAPKPIQIPHHYQIFNNVIKKLENNLQKIIFDYLKQQNKELYLKLLRY
jgi:DNA-binding transcriptional MerR regulator